MLDSATFDNQLDLFHSAPSPDRVTVYARLRDDSRLSLRESSASYTLAGTIRGPHCLYSTTLTTTADFKDAGPGETLLAKALVVDPCYWTPELPFLYDVEVELRREGEFIASAKREFGMRDLAVRGRFLYLNGKRFVVRGVNAAVDPDLFPDPLNEPRDFRIHEHSLSKWRELAAAMYVIDPSDDLCKAAAREGVLVMVANGMGADGIRRLARHASVAMVIGNLMPAYAQTHQHDHPNLLCVDVRSRSQTPSNSPALAVLDEGPADIGSVSNAAVPVLVCRYALLDWRSGWDLKKARAECDRLQATLAPYGDFAGYIV